MTELKLSRLGGGGTINNLDGDVVVFILSGMVGRKTGLILVNVDPGKTARRTKAILEECINPNMLIEDEGAQSGQ